MKLAMIGLGKMGANMVQRLMKEGHQCVGYDINLGSESVMSLVQEGVTIVATLAELVAKLQAPRIIWCMLPAGDITEKTVMDVAALLESGDIIIDGGNSMYKDDVRRAEQLAEKGIHYVDVGTSGGVWGLKRGYCLMIGGSEAAVKHLEPIFKSLSPGKGDIDPTPGRKTGISTADEGYMHCGPVGSGHYVKCLHNGIEYGLMQAYAEGFDIMRNANSPNLPENLRYDLNLPDIAEVWRRGSVVSSWLLDLTATALVEDPNLSGYEGRVEDSGEGRWTVQAAIDEAVPAHVLTAALYARFRSRQQNTFGEKMLSAMRAQFGGHIEKRN